MSEPKPMTTAQPSDSRGAAGPFNIGIDTSLPLNGFGAANAGSGSGIPFNA
jgi:hypothetical protein